MCAITGAVSLNKAIEIYEKQIDRGSFSSSLSVILNFEELNYDICRLQAQQFGVFTQEDIEMFRAINDDKIKYCIMHSQAPTSENSISKNIHPCQSIEYNSLLWHNGIIKNIEIANWNKKLKTNFNWDTELLLHLIDENGFVVLSHIDGSFACVYLTYTYKGIKLFCFRNEISPLYVDEEFNITSEPLKTSKLIDPGIVYEIDYINKQLKEYDRFETAQNPYFF
jgi:glucosamine 6-phosphate synthetase-like amidotransferase/phosphosugar isomerase protein